MFQKRKCQQCKRKIEDKYSFCPYCGYRLDADEEDDWGMLGKNDFTSIAEGIKLPMGFNSLFNSVMKNLSKELDKQLNNNYFPAEEKSKKIKRDGVSISISTFGNGPPKIRVSPMGNVQKPENEKKIERVKNSIFTRENIKRFADLPREEPRTDIRRLSNKVVYELEMPGVKSIDDISIIKLESSIEIKAIAKDRAYSKIIPINLPITGYNLSEGKLILELSIKNQ